MAVIDFPGRDRLISALDGAVALGDTPRIVKAVQERLQSLLHEQAFTLPTQVLQPVGDHYARRHLHSSAEYGYTMIAMTWGPGQGTPLHDHAGQWCVEGVVLGELDVTEYTLLERDGERCRFIEGRRLRAATGSTDGLMPPDEHHVIRNPSDDAITVSLHIYQREMSHCHVFAPLPEGDGWHRREQRQLGVD